MMSGIVNANPEVFIHLTVRDSSGQPHGVEVLIDTGYNGFLTLPSSLITLLGLPWLCSQPAQLAGGSIVTLDVYTATVEWHGQQRIVEVDAADSCPLLGMRIMLDSNLRIEVVASGTAEIYERP